MMGEGEGDMCMHAWMRSCVPRKVLSPEEALCQNMLWVVFPVVAVGHFLAPTRFPPAAYQCNLLFMRPFTVSGRIAEHVAGQK